MRGSALVVVAALSVSGCVSTHEFFLMGRTSGLTGSGTVPANGHYGGPITITLGNKEFKGQWVLAETGGGAEIATVAGNTGSSTALATGVLVSLPTGGNGSVLAAAPDGATLRCAFNFSEMNLKGTGACRDNKGEIYDLQIH